MTSSFAPFNEKGRNELVNFAKNFPSVTIVLKQMYPYDGTSFDISIHGDGPDYDNVVREASRIMSLNQDDGEFSTGLYKAIFG